MSEPFTSLFSSLEPLDFAVDRFTINGTLEKALKAYVKPSLLLLDELGYLPIDKRGADLLFQVVASRYESGSVVLTTN